MCFVHFHNNFIVPYLLSLHLSGWERECGNANAATCECVRCVNFCSRALVFESNEYDSRLSLAMLSCGAYIHLNFSIQETSHTLFDVKYFKIHFYIKLKINYFLSFFFFFCQKNYFN